MATKTDFTADEWKQIQRAPFMAGLAVVAASPSLPGDHTSHAIIVLKIV